MASGPASTHSLTACKTNDAPQCPKMPLLASSMHRMMLVHSMLGILCYASKKNLQLHAGCALIQESQDLVHQLWPLMRHFLQAQPRQAVQLAERLGDNGRHTLFPKQACVLPKV